MATTVRVFTCADQSQEHVHNPSLSTHQLGDCVTGGAWTTLTIPDEGAGKMDTVAMLIVVALVISAALGWIAGHQR